MNASIQSSTSEFRVEEKKKRDIMGGEKLTKVAAYEPAICRTPECASDAYQSVVSCGLVMKSKCKGTKDCWIKCSTT